MADLAALENLLQFLTPAEKAELDALLAQGPVWDPLPGHRAQNLRQRLRAELRCSARTVG